MRLSTVERRAGHVRVRAAGIVKNALREWCEMGEPRTVVMALDFHDGPKQPVRLTPVFLQSRTKEEIDMDEWLEKMGYNDFTCEDDEDA